MSFNAASIKRLDYDFTSFATNDGAGLCSGKGIIPEPSTARLDAFEKFRATFDAAAASEADESVLGVVRKATADLCGGSPTLEELEELPPRILAGFTQWLVEELSDPKA